MEDRYKKVVEAEEWAKQGTEMAENLLNFAKVMEQKMPEEDRKKFKEALGNFDMGDISPTIAKINKDIEKFKKKYQG